MRTRVALEILISDNPKAEYNLLVLDDDGNPISLEMKQKYLNNLREAVTGAVDAMDDLEDNKLEIKITDE